jgi:hypothetical protein
LLPLLRGAAGAAPHDFQSCSLRRASCPAPLAGPSPEGGDVVSGSCQGLDRSDTSVCCHCCAARLTPHHTISSRARYAGSLCRYRQPGREGRAA